jgi:hypothetical protein
MRVQRYNSRSRLTCLSAKRPVTLMQTLVSQLSSTLMQTLSSQPSSTFMQTLASQFSSTLMQTLASQFSSTLMQTLASQLSCKLSLLNSHQLSCKLSLLNSRQLSISFDQSLTVVHFISSSVQLNQSSQAFQMNGVPRLRNTKPASLHSFVTRCFSLAYLYALV